MVKWIVRNIATPGGREFKWKLVLAVRAKIRDGKYIFLPSVAGI